MYLLLAGRDDLLCDAVLASLDEKGRNVRVIGNPVLRPFTFVWRLDSENSTSRLAWEDGPSLSDREIEGILVRQPARMAAEGWDQPDLDYMQQESDATLLAWLWSLDCPVINRYPAALWYRPNMPLPFWLSLLEQNGLRGLPSLVSNVEEETRTFASNGGNQAVYAPLTAATRYPLVSDNLWKGLSAMQRLGPVHLTFHPPVSTLACVVGTQVVWNSVAPLEADRLESALVGLSGGAGLAFVEITIAFIEADAFVTAVNPYPCLEHFDQTAQTEIVANLVKLLVEGSGKLNSAFLRG